VEGARVQLVRADNPSPMTLAGTNSWVVEVDGEVWVVDPGPSEAGHIATLNEVAREMGTPAGVALTHDHLDHSEGVDALAEAFGGSRVLRFENADIASPFGVLYTPGHAADHLVFTIGDTLFSGDLILGQSSTIVPPGGGTLIAYLESLRKLAELAPRLILPGHGDPIEDAAAAVTAQRDHRLAREAALLVALADGLYDREALLDRVWSDVPDALRIAAHVTMQTHLEKLDLEGKLPDDFETEGRKSWQHRG
jgi:glyoxylase-like metal-dependent hydrolase (beta-lactamase superfamily II)